MIKKWTLGWNLDVPGALQSLFIDYDIICNVAPCGHAGIAHGGAGALEDDAAHGARHGTGQLDAL